MHIFFIFLLLLFSLPLQADILPLVNAFALPKEKTLKELHLLTEMPHTFGSKAQKKVKNRFLQEMLILSLKPTTQEFQSNTPTGMKQGYNILAFSQLNTHPSCYILVGSHYDTKDLGDEGKYLGANDGGSSSVALLSLITYLHQLGSVDGMNCDVVGVWLDGEEAVLKEWNASTNAGNSTDHTYGSRHFADSLTSCPQNSSKCFPETSIPVQAFILMDMIGSKTLQLSQETNSSKSLRNLAENLSNKIFDKSIFAQSPKAIEDDHLPFLDQNIPSINLINFEDLQTWHNPSDTIENLSLDNIEKVAKLVLAMVLTISSNPQNSK